MNLSENYYETLGLTKVATQKEVKKSYYKLSFEHHPDKGGDSKVFAKITEAYDILMDDSTKSEYDRKSKWGLNYDESLELLDFEFNNSAKAYNEKEYEDFKKKSVLNVLIYTDDKFNGSIEYERWILCKKCGGSGKDIDSKIEIKDEKGNILRIFDGSDGCDFCEGTGKDYFGKSCGFCGGNGKVGSNDCSACNGERRILGKQKLSGIKFPKDSDSHKIESMGHSANNASGMCGHVWLIKKDQL